jgi:hypothetical protein
MPRPQATVFASFSLPDGEPAIRAMASLAGLPGLGELFVFDEGMHQNLAATGFHGARGRGHRGRPARRQGKLDRSSRWLDRTARAGRAHLADVPWSLHVSIDGCRKRAEDARAEAARRIAAFDGDAIPDVIRASRGAKPFRPIKALITPLGERWLPSHGLCRSAARRRCSPRCRHADGAVRTKRKQHRVRSGFLIALLGPRITIEPQLYWPDALSDYTRAMAQPDQVKHVRPTPANETGRSPRLRLRASSSMQ